MKFLKTIIVIIIFLFGVMYSQPFESGGDTLIGWPFPYGRSDSCTPGSIYFLPSSGFLFFIIDILILYVVYASFIYLVGNFKKNREAIVFSIILSTIITIYILDFSKPYKNKSTRMNSNIAKQQISRLGMALDMYRLDTDIYPNHLDDLYHNTDNILRWKGPYLDDNIPLDPWGYYYQYRPKQAGRTFKLYSYGADGKPKGEGHNADIMYD